MCNATDGWSRDVLGEDDEVEVFRLATPVAGSETTRVVCVSLQRPGPVCREAMDRLRGQGHDLPFSPAIWPESSSAIGRFLTMAVVS